MRKRILAVLLILVSILSLAGCSQDKPEQVVSELFDAIKNTDMEKLATILGEDSGEITEQEAFMQLIKKSNESLTYKIGEVSIDGETAIVNVSCTYGDVKAIFGVAFSEYMQKAIAAAFSETPPSEEEIDKMLSDEIVSALDSTPPTEHSAELKVNCIKTDGKWAIDTSTENTELADVLTGNLVSTFTEMANSMNETSVE